MPSRKFNERHLSPKEKALLTEMRQEGRRNPAGDSTDLVNNPREYVKLNNESHAAYCKRLARIAAPEAMVELVKIAKDGRKGPSVQLKAIGMLLDRAYGKPTVHVESTAQVNTPITELSTAELAEVLKLEIPKRTKDDAMEELVDVRMAKADKERKRRMKLDRLEKQNELPTPEILASDGHDAT